MARRSIEEIPRMSEEERLTLLDLVSAVDEAAESEAEALATLRHLFETGLSLEAVDLGALPSAA